MVPKLAAKTDTALVGPAVVGAAPYGSQRFPSQHFSSQEEKTPVEFINVHAVKKIEENNCISRVLL